MSSAPTHPRIILAGCGYTGERCADFFSKEGWHVTGLVSSESSARRLSSKPYRVLALDAADPTQLRAAADSIGPVDLLVHCLSGQGGRDADSYRITYFDTLRNLIEVFAPSFTVFTSSTSVYPNDDGAQVAEDSPVGGTPTGDVLLQAERLALNSGGAAVRLGGIYGPGRSRFIDAARSGEPLPHGAPDAFINLIHRDDAARALFHVGSHNLPGLFNAVDDTPQRRADLAASILAAFSGSEQPPTTTTKPSGKRVSNAKLRETGWAPVYPSVREAILHDPSLRATVSD